MIIFTIVFCLMNQKLLCNQVYVCTIAAGDIILVDNAENLLLAVRKVVDDIHVATIEIKDQGVREKLGLKWVKRDVCSVKRFGPVFMPNK